MKKERDEKQTIIDFQQTFGTEAGKNTLRKLKRVFPFATINPPVDKLGRYDPLQMAKKEGEREVLIYIHKMINKDPYEVRQKKAINYERENDG